MLNLKSKKQFKTGELNIHDEVRHVVPHDAILDSLDRHQEGDWGIASYEDVQMNEIALKRGYMILSTYLFEGYTYDIKTNGDRTETRVVLH